MRDNTYVVIQAFMLNELHLKGNELIVYAVIYGYTQDGNHWYYGTRGHLAEWCGASKGTVTNSLNSLVKKGYIVRREVPHPGNVEVQYQASFCNGVPKISMGGGKNYDAPVVKISSINNLSNKTNDNGSEKREYPNTIRCVCGSDMRKTATCEPKTERPLYRCDECGEERYL